MIFFVRIENTKNLMKAINPFWGGNYMTNFSRVIKNQCSSIALVALFGLLLVACFAGCGSPQAPASSSLNMDESSSVNDISQDDAKALSALEEQLKKIAGLEVGTAGASLKAVKVAVGLLDWAAQTPLSAEQISDAANIFYDSLPQESRAMFSEQVLSVKSCTEQLAVGGEQAKELLDTAGVTPKQKHYDPSSIAPLWEALIH